MQQDGIEMSEANSAPMALSVLIPCYNAEATLGETLEALVTQRWDEPWEIVLADNGSTDGSAALFRSVAAANPGIPMRVVDASAQRGQPFALNVAMAAAQAPAFAFCDADDVPGEGWVAAMGRALAEHPLVACRFDFDRLNRGWVRAYRGQMQEEGLDPLPFLPGLVHAGGGSLGFHRSVIDRIGGFDTDFIYLLDTEFCVRAQLAGYTIHFVPEAVMHIRSRQSLPSIFRQSFNWGLYEMKLVARHRDRGVPFRGGGRHFLHSWWRVLRTNLRKGLRPTPETMVNAARLRNRVGRLSGNFAGMLRYRVPPYRPPEIR
jgi:cellulose synthase/poly-beta-1,6-N-acetylglucosamine synthase-like glycosyltransferase